MQANLRGTRVHPVVGLCYVTLLSVDGYWYILPQVDFLLWQVARFLSCCCTRTSSLPETEAASGVRPSFTAHERKMTTS